MDRDRQEKEKQNRQPDEASVAGAQKRSGDPGRTPGTAEGDEKTVDQSLGQKEGGPQ